MAIPEPFGAQLQEVRGHLGDPLATSVPAHITLIPPTVVAPDEVPGVERHLARIGREHPPFDVVLAGTGTFRPISPVVFVRLERGADRCAALEADVRSGVLAQPLRFPYHPHVTIAHDLDEPALDHAEAVMADFRAPFPVDRFWLYEHGDDGVWRAVHDVRLSGA